ncbi:MAG: 4-hydroxythreonine-4-phosphate dehydrogenase PdxA [Streptosporangiales bacterium]|nr:4-hydroxythreonine-4-phosphate dehydrogenase PdxA [Streptosporangiales bacterium]
MTASAPLLGHTLGDPAGVGPEITLKALAEPEVRRAARNVILGDAAIVERTAADLGLDLKIRRVTDPADVPTPDGTNVVYALHVGDAGPVEPGVVHERHGRAAVAAVGAACALAVEGRLDGIVTAPLNKEAIKAAGSPYPGHTEMLAELLGVGRGDVVTVFVLDRLRIFFLTRHLPLARAIAELSVEQVRDGLVRTDELLGELGFTDPTVALAALNPHAGENGLLGGEENAILGPAVEAARAAGVNAVGPVPADAVFHQARHGKYDGVVSLYHDQGHIAAKTLDFFGTVSCTLGLPVLRTSVDHGTAFDIAGQGIADPGGQVRAVLLAAELAPRVLDVRGRRPAR